MIALSSPTLEVKSTVPSSVRLRLLPSPSPEGALESLAEPYLHDLLEEARRIAVLEERKRITRDLHDTLAQGFTGVIIQLEAADGAHLAGDHEVAVRHVLRAARLARESLSDMRRCLHGLRPQALEGMDLDEALRRFVSDATEGTSLCASVLSRGRIGDIPRQFYTNLLHIAQEALSNTLKHARATSFGVRLSTTKGNLRLEFRDNGVGIEATRDRGGIGLVGMRERVQEIGGTLSVTSSRGGGTRILVTRPIPNLIPVPRYPESSRDLCDFAVAENSLACALS